MNRNRTTLLITLIFCLGGMFLSCGGNTGSNDSIAAERDSLKILADENQRELERMTNFFNDVAACIDSISEQENLLTLTIDPETNRRYSSREMTARLNQLSEIINSQRARIVSLVDSLTDSMDTTRINGLTNTIAFLNKQLNQKEAQIAQIRAELNGERRNVKRLTSQVAELSNAVDDLSSRNEKLTEAVQVQTEIINEGYILVGDTDRLRSLGIIEGGGFLKKSKVNLANVNYGNCIKVDISQFRDLPINSNKFKILTPVPEGSYSLIRTNTGYNLNIIDPTAFWSLSSVLVIQIK